MRPARRRRIAAALGAIAATVLPLAPAASRPGLAAPAVPAVAVRITALSPTIGGPGSRVVVDGEVVNVGAADVPAPTVTLRGSQTGLTRRGEIAAWAAGGATGIEVTTWDQERLAGTLAPGESRAFTVAGDLLDAPDTPYAALPLALDAGGTRVATFLPVAPADAYPPLEQVVVLPVTMRPHRALFGDFGGSRQAAWLAEIGPDGRLSRLLEAAADAPVAWAIDPTLLAAPEAVAAERPIDPAAGAAWDRIGPHQRTEVAARRAFRQALIDATRGRECFVLPMADADLAAGQSVPTAQGLLRDQVRAGIREAQTNLPACATGILWPADGLLSSARGGELAAYLPNGRPDALLGRAASTPGGSTASVAAWRTANGTPALAYDDALSAALLGLEQDPGGVVTGQRLLADSLALFLQAPATSRRVLLVGSRDLSFTGTGLREALARLRQAPWLRPASLTALRLAAGDGPVLSDSTPTDVAEPVDVPRDPVASAAPAITTTRLRTLQHALDQVETTAKVRADGPEQVRLWGSTLTQLLSARWRGDGSQFQGQMRRLRAAGTTAGTAVQVTPETINFFADTGRLQLTVTNTLAVGLNDLRVDLTPLSSWLRLDGAPRTIDVGARSKAVVTVHATALAAGTVPIRARLAAPDGSAVGPDTTVMVRVRPTGDWIYWTMAGVAGVLLLLGVRRSRRGRSARRGPAR